MKPGSTDRPLRATGVIAWVGVMVSMLGEAGGWPGACGLVGMGGFLVATAATASERARQVGAVVQLSAATGLAASGRFEFAVVPFVIAATVLPTVFAGRAAVVVGVMQAAVSTALAFTRGASAAELLANVAFQGFAFVASATMKREAQARAELVEAHEALVGVQRELAVAHRAAERLHIARELHDRTGHLLTALILRLEVALHVDDTRARSEVAQARAQAKDLLREVREVVAALRDPAPFDLREALVELAGEAPLPRVELEVLAEPPVDGERSLVLLRCAQEGVTNARRHAGASRVLVQLRAEGDGWVLSVSDDGAANPGPFTRGAGLRGLEERLAGVGGALDVSRTAQGLTLTARIPGNAS